MDLLGGYRYIYVFDRRFYRFKLARYNPLQALVTDMLLYSRCLDKGSVSGRVSRVFRYGSREYIFLSGSGDIPSDLVYPSSNGFLCWNELLEVVPDRPLFIVDNTLYYEHHPKDRNRLVNQLNLFLKVLRRYLFDIYLIMNNSPVELVNRFNSIAGHNMVRWTRTWELKRIIHGDDNIIALDPYAEEVIDEQILRKASIIVIGGIVDRERQVKMGTRRIVDKLCSELGIEIERYRVEVDGIREAVPHRINIFGEIILETIFEEKPLRQAIIEHMSNRDIAWYIGLRLAKEKLDQSTINQVIDEIEKIQKRKIKKYVIEKAYRIGGMRKNNLNAKILK